jgi:tryptophanyl-tRNA synthetase
MEHTPTTKDTVLTGDRPTGPLHLGHYVGSLKQRLALQEAGIPMYVLVADTQALTDNFNNPQKVHDNIAQVGLDYLAVGREQPCLYSRMYLNLPNSFSIS